MTPLEKAKAEEGRVNYCDECEQFEIVGNAAYCKVDGKLIHPIMMARGQGTGPAWNCKKRRKPVTNADKIRSMSDEEMAEFMRKGCDDRECPDISFPADTPFAKDASNEQCQKCWLDWLRKEAQDG